MLQAAIREGQQRSIEGALGVLQYGVVLVDVLHDFRVELVLLGKKTKNIQVEKLSQQTLTLQKELGDRECVCQGWSGGWCDLGQNSALASFKAKERSIDDPANHISMTNCLPAVQMASMPQPSGTCCLLEMLPLCPHGTEPIYVGAERSCQILLKRLLRRGDRLVCLKCRNKMPLCGHAPSACTSKATDLGHCHTLLQHWSRRRKNRNNKKKTLLFMNLVFEK